MKHGRRLLLGIVVLSAACSSIVERPGAEAPLPTAGDGTVVLSVTANTGEIRRFDTIVFADESGKGPQYQLTQATVDAGRDTALFVGTLPAGRYVIQQLTYHYEHGSRTLEPKTSAMYPGVIDIAAGRSNDLGRIVVTAVGEHVWVGRSRRDTNSSGLLHLLLPQKADALIALRREGWRDAPQDSDGAELHALTHPVGVQSMVELSDGTVAAASRVGSLLLRDRNGRWATVDTGRLEALRWVAEDADPGQWIVAAGELDTLLLVTRDGHLANVDTRGLPAGDLVFVSPMPDLSWVVVLENRDHYTFYRTETLMRPVWVAIGSEPRASDVWNDLDRIWPWRTERGFAYASSAGGIHHYDAMHGSWQSSTLPGGGVIANAASGFGGFVSVIGAASTETADLFSSTWVSTDFGATWQSVNSPFHLRPSPLESLPDGRWLAYGGSYGHYSVQSTSDQGKTWTPFGEPLQAGDRLKATPTAGIFRISDSLAAITDILHSADGAQWTLERTSRDEPPVDAAPLSDLRTLRRRS